MGFSAKVLADSIGIDNRVRLTTLEVTFPRIVLAEFNTHRMFSRNSASSRAIPVEKRIAAVKADPFIPAAFGKNQKGMQAAENLGNAETEAARTTWLGAMAVAVDAASALANIGVHKQLANRLIEPFCWQTVIVSATEWGNFFALRCHPDAQPEIRQAAELMRDAMDASTPRELGTGQWHLPLMPDIDKLQAEEYSALDLCRISSGRCARVSYLTHAGQRDPQADIGLALSLQQAGHMSPFEHVARPLGHGEEADTGNFRAWLQFRKTLPGEAVFGR